MLGDEKDSRLVLLTDTVYPRLLVTLGGADSFREPMEIDAESFVGIKGVKARGRRVTAFNVKDVEELVPLRMPEPDPEPEIPETDTDDNDNSAQTDNDNTEKVDDGQLSLF